MSNPQKILLVCDSCTDEFIYGSCDRLCPDVPAPVLLERHKTTNGGMGLNVYNNIKSLGGEVEIITNQNYADYKKTRFVEEDNNYTFLRWDKDIKIDRITGLDKIDYSKYACIAVSDYHKNYLWEDDIQYLSEQCNLTFLDTKKKINSYANQITYIKQNHKEYLASKPYLSPLLESKIIETMGPRGCRFGNEIFPVKEQEVRSVSGAGDSFFAAIIVKFIETGDMRKAIHFGNSVATISIGKRGVTAVTLDEVKQNFWE